jgi:3-oxoacyl-[acyl-carrier protein] reductase
MNSQLPTPHSQRTKGERRPVALVTGGTRGIGLGIARALAADGWDLMLCGVRPEDAVAEAVAEISSAGGDVGYQAADVSQPGDRARLVEAISERFGGLDALVNNAGRAPRVRADLLEATEESFDEVLRTNLYGPYFLTQRCIPLLLDARRDRPAARRGIVFVTSVSAEMVSTNRGEYCVSKAGLAMAARLYAVRLAEHGLPVYEVRPGVVSTDMTAKVRDMYDRRIAEGLVPEGRWGTSEDVGRTVAALLRGDVPYGTGSVIHVDGALSIPRL